MWCVRRVSSAILGGVRRGVDVLEFVAVGVTAGSGERSMGPRAGIALALDAHGEVQHRGERRHHAILACFDQLFYQLADGPIVRSMHPVLLGKGESWDRRSAQQVSKPQDAPPWNFGAPIGDQ